MGMTSVQELEDMQVPKHVESTVSEPTTGRQGFGFTPEQQPQEEQTSPAGETGQQEQDSPAEEDTKQCWYCKEFVGKRYRHLGHLACRDCVAKDADAEQPEAAAVPDEQADANQQEGVKEGKEAQSALPPDAPCECENGHKFPYKVLVQGELGFVCPECGSGEWRCPMPEQTQEQPQPQVEVPHADPNDMLRCSVGHQFYRSSLIESPLCKPPHIGKCPVCQGEGIATLVTETQK